jgi:hypothetical protein
MAIDWPSWIATLGTRAPSTKTPTLPSGLLSMAIHCASVKRSTTSARGVGGAAGFPGPSNGMSQRGP